MKRMMLMVLTTLLVLVVGGVDGVGQTKKVPTVWLIDDTPNNFGDFWNPFTETIKNLRLGNRLRIHKDWDGVWNDKSYSPRDGDIYIELHSVQNDGGGFAYMMVYGYMDGCSNWVYVNARSSFCSGNDCTYALRSSGYEYGNQVIQYLNERLGR